VVVWFKNVITLRIGTDDAEDLVRFPEGKIGKKDCMESRLMDHLKIATWNLETDKPLQQWRADAFRHAIESVKADVWVITEPLLSFSPGPEFRLIAQSDPADDIDKQTNPRWAADRRWVAIWSKVPAERVEVLNEPDRLACIRVEQPGHRDVVIVGTVLPWPGDAKWPGKDGAGFCQAVRRQAVEWKRLREATQSAGFCVIGDFNQSLPYFPRFGPKPSAKALWEALDSLGLACLTGHEFDPLPRVAGKPSVDHICIGGGLQPISEPPSRTWTIPIGPTSLPITDHFGACVDLKVLPLDLPETANDSK